jgi:hypothetical protein
MGMASGQDGERTLGDDRDFAWQTIPDELRYAGKHEG